MTLLIVSLNSSKCGACNRNADPMEERHEMAVMKGEGCGALFTQITTSYPDAEEATRNMRPDLDFVGGWFREPPVQEASLEETEMLTRAAQSPTVHRLRERRDTP